jgi:hypothetical protein
MRDNRSLSNSPIAACPFVSVLTQVWDFDFEYRFDITLRADCLEW